MSDNTPEPLNPRFGTVHAAEGLHVEWVEGEAVVFNPETAEIHYLNGSAALAYACIAEHGFERGVEEFRELFKDQEDLEGQIDPLVDNMLAKGLLVR